jgi:hypothetical protein
VIYRETSLLSHQRVKGQREPFFNWLPSSLTLRGHMKLKSATKPDAAKRTSVAHLSRTGTRGLKAARDF